jgi:hypothetical protein
MDLKPGSDLMDFATRILSPLARSYVTEDLCER